MLDDLPVHDISDVTVTESSTDDPQKEGGNQPSFDAVTRLRKRGASDPVESGKGKYSVLTLFANNTL